MRAIGLISITLATVVLTATEVWAGGTVISGLPNRLILPALC
jgi:hypothetical protein